MPTEMLTGNGHRTSVVPAPPPARTPGHSDELRAAERSYARRLRRLKLNAAAWAVGTAVITVLWAVNEWQDNGVFERFGHEGDPGQWNPTLWAAAIGAWSLVVGIMALGVLFVRPTAEYRTSLVQRAKFHVAAWVYGLVVLTPVWALIEWQDNGAFERWSSNDQPGSWDPWILIVAGVWALLAVAVVGVRALCERPPKTR